MVAMGREYLAGKIRAHLPEVDARPIAELIVRTAATFILMPDSVIDLDTADDVRRFARTHLIPMVPR
jgi:hypothetical protein